MKFIIQTVLRMTPDDGTAYTETVTWLPEDKRVKVGSVISLKSDIDSKVRWRVVEQGARLQVSEINRGWGLNLPWSQRTEI